MAKLPSDDHLSIFVYCDRGSGVNTIPVFVKFVEIILSNSLNISKFVNHLEGMNSRFALLNIGCAQVEVEGCFAVYRCRCGWNF